MHWKSIAKFRALWNAIVGFLHLIVGYC